MDCQEFVKGFWSVSLKNFAALKTICGLFEVFLELAQRERPAWLQRRAAPSSADSEDFENSGARGGAERLQGAGASWGRLANMPCFAANLSTVAPKGQEIWPKRQKSELALRI
jgi:hypothetical protein